MAVPIHVLEVHHRRYRACLVFARRNNDLDPLAKGVCLGCWKVNLHMGQVPTDSDAAPREKPVTKIWPQVKVCFAVGKFINSKKTGKG